MYTVFLFYQCCCYVNQQMSLQSEDYGKHLLSVQDLLEKHNLLEADIVTINERVKAINSQANKFIDQGLFRTYIRMCTCVYVCTLCMCVCI